MKTGDAIKALLEYSPSYRAYIANALTLMRGGTLTNTNGDDPTFRYVIMLELEKLKDSKVKWCKYVLAHKTVFPDTWNERHLGLIEAIEAYNAPISRIAVLMDTYRA